VKWVLVANRGDIAVRVVRACRTLDLESVVAVSAADRDSMAARLADRVVCIGPASASLSYLNQDAMLAAALGTGADAVHPGYGFLAENAGFAAACTREGLRFVGPASETVDTMGNKLSAREVARTAGVPLVPGSDTAWPTSSKPARPPPRCAARCCSRRPPAAGVAASASSRRPMSWPAPSPAPRPRREPRSATRRCTPSATSPPAGTSRSRSSGDGHGRVLHLGERDCSLQRRYQKVLEEAPAATLPEHARAAIHRSAVLLAQAIGYENAGTVEFLYDEERDDHYFPEMNTRIQVEHPITEMVTGVDLVRLQLQVAAGDSLPFTQDQVSVTGHAVECRINAESPEQDFRPSPGWITRWTGPEGPGVRLDTHCFEGYVVPPFYDSLLGKLIVHGRDRAEALQRTRTALRDFEVEGVATTIPFHRWLLEQPDVASGRFGTRWLETAMPGFRR
jgi:acetyl-CoA carboxylase biotin carboxylase subunit